MCSNDGEGRPYKDQFCRSIASASLTLVRKQITCMESDLQNYEQEEKPGYFLRRRQEIRQEIETNIYKTLFSASALQENLQACLETYFSQHVTFGVFMLHCRQPFSPRQLHKFSLRLMLTLGLHLLGYHHHDFDFSTLTVFKPLIEYIVACVFFMELNRQKALVTAPNDDPDTASEDDPPPTTSNATENNSWLHLFKEGGYELFCYLDEEYSNSNKCFKAKFSNIYHFMKYENMLVGSQIDYIDFIHSVRNVSMTRILPKNDKYKDQIFPLLRRLNSKFRKNSKNDVK